MKKRSILALFLVASLGMLTGCQTSAAENAATYWEQMGQVKDTLSSNVSASGKEDSAKESNADQLATPTDFTLDENGNYSFTGVENADYYLIYFCDTEATGDSDAFLYSSDSIAATGEGGESYTGNIDDILKYGYGEYLAKVYAFPSMNDTDHSVSSAATASFVSTGAQDTPTIDYLWNTYDNTMEVQLSNVDVYMYESYPDSVDVTFTNVENESDSVIVTIQDVSADNYTAVSDALTRGTTYNITAVNYSQSEYVTNNTSDVTDVAENVTCGESNVMSENYYFTDGIARSSFSYPQVCENFNLAEGGVIEPGAGLTYTFDATPTTPNEGSSYSYTVACGHFFASLDGVLELYEDGTLMMNQPSDFPPEGPSSIQGTWIDNGDGTATLSFDHSTVTTFVD